MRGERLKEEKLDIIAVSLAEEPHPSLEISGERRTHCYFMGRALDGEALRIHRRWIGCPLGRFHMGHEQTEVQEVVDFLLKTGDAEDEELARLYLDSGWRLADAGPYVTYFPFPFEDFEADVLIAIGTPLQMGPLVHEYARRTARRVVTSVSGLGAACGECTVYPLLSGRPNLSLGCKGCRRSMKVDPDRVLPAVPRSSRMFDTVAKHGR